jgi:YidC/Oxa1 family membrane protein insertase
MDALPWFDAGVIVVLFTILIKLALYPLSKKASISQIRMKEIEPELKAVKEKHKDDSQELARRTMEIYKQNKVNPFSSIFVILIQLPIIFSLYYVFFRSGLPSLNMDLLYAFIPRPETINMNFLGLIDITEKSVVLALLAGISSFVQALVVSPKLGPKGPNPSLQDDLARGMSMQMKYIFPVIVFFISITVSGVVALYWFTSNVFTVFQELYIRRTIKKSPVS